MLRTSLHTKKSTKVVARHQSATAGKLYRVLAEGNDKNAFLSPFSISTALTVLAAGADGDTASQIQTALALPKDMASLHEEYQEVLVSLQNPANVELSTSNNLYVQGLDKILNSYECLLKEKYLSGIVKVDCKDHGQMSRLINGEIGEKTRGRIKDTINPGDFGEDNGLVLINAISFKGSWKRQFDTKMTRKRDFFVTPENTVKTDMMFMNKVRFICGSIPELKCKALEMSYEGDRFSMLMLLPDLQDGLKDLESKLSSSSAMDIRERLTNQMAFVAVPKFKLETSYDLKKPLQNLGIRDLFSFKADLSKISKDTDLYVSNAVHKAFIEVNEEGTEAKAVTVFESSVVKCLQEPRRVDLPFYFIADHPFFFVIFDRLTELTLFSGHYVNPV